MSMCMDIKKYFIAFVLMYVGFSEASESFFSYQALRPDHPLDRIDMMALEIKTNLLREDAKKREYEVRLFEEKMASYKSFRDDFSLLEAKCKADIANGHNDAVCKNVKEFYDEYCDFLEGRTDTFSGVSLDGPKAELMHGAMSYFGTIQDIFREIKASDFNLDLIKTAIDKKIPHDENDVTLGITERMFLAFCKRT